VVNYSYELLSEILHVFFANWYCYTKCRYNLKNFYDSSMTKYCCIFLILFIGHQISEKCTTTAQVACKVLGENCRLCDSEFQGYYECGQELDEEAEYFDCSGIFPMFNKVHFHSVFSFLNKTNYYQIIHTCKLVLSYHFNTKWSF